MVVEPQPGVVGWSSNVTDRSGSPVDTSRTNTCSRRSPARPAGSGSKRSGTASHGCRSRLAYHALISVMVFVCAEISSGTAELAASTAPCPARRSQPSSQVRSTPGQAAAAACSSARIAAVRTGASVRTRRATTSTGENSTMVPVLVCTRTVGSTASSRPTASVSGGIDPAGRR